MNENPFAELPAALVQEVLERTDEISQALLKSFDNIRDNKAIWRSQLIEKGVVQKVANLPLVPIPTCCGVDGSLAIERLLAVDLVAVGAVAVEGLTPPSENRYWPEPQHLVYVDTEAHEAESSSILRGIMMGMELKLAQNAPHEVVFLDGSLTTPTIFFNQALSKLEDAPDLKISVELTKTIRASLEAYKEILTARRSDHYWVAMPKYTTKREIGEAMKWPEAYDDRGLLSMLLEAGEYTKPMLLSSPKAPWHINTKPVKTGESVEIEELVHKVTSLLKNVNVIYYRPFTWLPALRVELAQSIAQTPARLSTVLKAVEHQCGSAAIMEPYPLYMADRMVKHLAKSVPAFRQVANQRLAEKYQGDISEIFMSLHGYRTESGV
ncbi:MAG: DNA double-strand break repair nuclease NurA [Anaerolineales bacterium]|nr:DNA double-strand break repair nuclease NurA [Anaerolineales bacterium]